MFLKALLYLYVLVLPYEYLFWKVFDSLTVWKPHRIMGVTLILFWLVRTAFRKQKLSFDIFDKAFCFIFSYGALLALFWKIFGDANLRWAFDQMSLIGFSLMIYFVVKNMRLNSRDIATVLYILIFSCLINSIYMIYEFQTILNPYQMRGFGRNPTQAAYMIGAATLALVSIFLFRVKRIVSLPGIFSISGILFFFYAIFLTGSRGSILGVLVGFLSIAALLLGNRKRAFKVPLRRLTLLFGSISVILLIFFVIKGFSIDKDRYRVASRFEIENILLSGRLDTWRSSLNVALDHYFMGVGIAQYRRYHLAYVSKLRNLHSSTVLEYQLVTHSDFLSLIAEYGIFSLAVYLFVVILLTKKLFFAAKTFSKESFIYPAFFSIFGFLITCGLFRVSFAISFSFLLWGLSISAIKLTGESRSELMIKSMAPVT